MALLLDTHVLLWWLLDSRRLRQSTRARILAAPFVYVSSVSIWETAIKVHSGKLNVDMDYLAEQMARAGFRELVISHRHAARVALLPDIHRDPFDRLLVAQAICEPLTLLTADRVLADYSELVDIV